MQPVTNPLCTVNVTRIERKTGETWAKHIVIIVRRNLNAIPGPSSAQSSITHPFYDSLPGQRRGEEHRTSHDVVEVNDGTA